MKTTRLVYTAQSALRDAQRRLERAAEELRGPEPPHDGREPDVSLIVVEGVISALEVAASTTASLSELVGRLTR